VVIKRAFAHQVTASFSKSELKRIEHSLSSSGGASLSTASIAMYDPLLSFQVSGVRYL